MQYILKRAILAVLGVVVMIAWWTITGGPGSNDEVKGIPAKVWEADGGTLAVEVETTSPAKFSISFGDEKDRSMTVWTKVDAGSHNWSVEIPSGAGGYIELGAEDPKVGDKMQWKVTLDGNTVEEQSETLSEPLKSGYAFFLQSYYDDYSKMEVEED